MKKIVSFIVLPFFLLASHVAYAGDYEVDIAHSRVAFSVKHMVITNVIGNFTDFSGSFSFDETTKKFSAIHAVVKTASINTDIEKRDNHLRSPDFFDVAKFPEMTFDFKSATIDGDEIAVTGDLMIRGVTRPVVLKGEFLGAVKDPWGNQRVGFTASGKINRFDFGLTWNKLLESGGLVVDEKVKILLEVEGILKQEKQSE